MLLLSVFKDLILDQRGFIGGILLKYVSLFIVSIVIFTSFFKIITMDKAVAAQERRLRILLTS